MANDVTIRVRVKEELGGLDQVKALLMRTVGGAIVPATAAVAALGVELVGAGAALGVFGAAVAPQAASIKKVATEQDAYNDAVTEYGKSSTQAATAQKKFRGDMDALAPATRGTAQAFIGLKSDFAKWSDSLSGTTMPIFTKGIEALRGILPQLTPFVKDAAKQVGELVDQFAKFSRTDKFKEMVKEFEAFSKGALQNVIEGVKVLVQTVAGWATSDGFKNFLETGKKEGPGVAKMFQNLAEFVGKFVAAAGPLAGLQLKALEFVADALNAIPEPMLKILAPAILGIAAATKVWTLAQLAFDAAADANPYGAIVMGLVAMGVAIGIAWKKSETFREIVTASWGAVSGGAAEMVKLCVKYFKFFFDVWTTVVGAIVHGAAEAFGWVPGVGPMLKKADKAFQDLKTGVDKSLNGVINKMNEFQQSTFRATQERILKLRIDNWNKNIETAKKRLSTVPENKKADIRANIADLKKKVADAKAALASLRNRTLSINIVTTKTTSGTMAHEGGGYAHGGIIGAASGGNRGSRVLVGEQGPEIVDLPFGSRVNSNPDTMRMMSGAGGSTTPFGITIMLGDNKITDLLVDPLRKSIQKRGGVQAAFGKL